MANADEFIVPKSYGRRIEESIVGFLVGIVLLLLVPVVLWVVERQVARYALMLKRCRIASREIPVCDMASPDNTERPVMVKGYTRRCGDDDTLTDVDTGYRGPDTTTIHRPVKKELIRLMRRVEMYQWVELQSMEENRTVYTYTQRWSQYDQCSRLFQRPEEHENPPCRIPPLYSTTINAPDVAIGVYLCNATQVDMLTSWEPCHIRELPPEVLKWTDNTGKPLESRVETSTEPSTDIFQVAASLSPSLMGSYASSASLTASDVVVDTKPHHKRPKQPTDYIVLNGSLEAPSIGTVRICYYMVLSGGPVTTLAVQTPVQPWIPNLHPFSGRSSRGGGTGSEGESRGDVGGAFPQLKEGHQKEAERSKELEVAYPEDTAAVDEEEAAGARTPNAAVQYTFRPFTEEDAHRTLSWGLCCGKELWSRQAESRRAGTGDDEHFYGRYLHTPHHSSFSSYPSFSSSTTLSAPSTAPKKSAVNPAPSSTKATFAKSATTSASSAGGSEVAPTSGHHEYQSLNRSGEDVSSFPSDSNSCCPSINSCVGMIVGSEITLLEERFVSKEALFQDKLDEFQRKVLMARVGSYLLLSLAFFLMLKPFASILSFLPYIGSLLLNFFWVVSLLGGFVLGILVSGVAWVIYQPQILTGIFLIVGGLLAFIPHHPRGHQQRQTAETLHVIGCVLLGLTVLPLGLVVYQKMEEYHFIQLQKLLDDTHNEHTHRHNRMLAKKQLEADDDARSRDSQALTLFAVAGERNKAKAWEADRKRMSSASSDGDGVVNEATHLLARGDKDEGPGMDIELGGGVYSK